MHTKTLIMKFGGASLSSLAHIEKAAEIVAIRRKECREIVVVVSAMGEMTDQLLNMAYELSASPATREIDMLISAGERMSIGLLAIALEKRGVAAISLTGSQLGIITTNDHTNAKIIDVRPLRVPSLLSAGKVIVAAGFQGVSLDKEITTLGRGGSDTTAVALGVALQAEYVEFYKDVGGVYSDDPKKNKESTFLPSLTYKEALSLFEKTGSSILHPRAIELAAVNGLPLWVLPYQKEVLEKNPKGSLIVENGLKKREEPLFEVSWQQMAKEV